MYVINLIPALAGRPVIDLLKVYVNQSIYDNRLSGCAANICYIFVDIGITDGNTLYKFILIIQIVITLTLMICLLIFIFCKNIKKTLNFNNLVLFSMIFSFIMVMFMPKMLDRFYFISFSVIYLNICKTKLDKIFSILI